VCVRVSVYALEYTCTCAHVHVIPVCMHVCVCVCVCVFVFVCVRVCVCVCVCVCVLCAQCCFVWSVDQVCSMCVANVCVANVNPIYKIKRVWALSFFLKKTDLHRCTATL
jgi:hypothetical protein